jgi:hypothetical protein
MELADYRRQRDEEEKRKQEDLHEKKLEEFARQHHYLVSTVVLPGVFNSPFQVNCVFDEFRAFLHIYSCLILQMLVQ